MVSSELKYITEKISKQYVNDMTWYFIAVYSKIQAERDKFRKELLSKKEPEFFDVEILNLSRLQKLLK